MARGIVLVCLVVLTCVAGQAAAARPLVTAIHEPNLRQWWTEHPLLFDRVQRTGSKAIRIWLDWKGVAPSAPTNAADPADPAYVWAHIDLEVAAARARGLRVILTLREAPSWAERPAGGRQGTNDPDPAQFGLFAQAAAIHFHGQVFDWEIWNEPNLSYFLWPQYDGGGDSVAPATYRALLNAAARAIHEVDPRNRVLAGATAPFADSGSHSPLTFARRVLCMSASSPSRPTCDTRVEFDLWSHHPYSHGSPTREAYDPNNVSVADLPELFRLLRAAERAGHIVSDHPLGLWVTEWGWDTKGPDSAGVPLRLHARWTAEGLYRMWKAGVGLVTWWLLRDRPFPEDMNQSGLYFCGAAGLADEGSCRSGPAAADVAKARTVRAFRFPFVAFPQARGRLLVWGRTPSSTAGRVLVERRIRGRYRRIALLRAGAHGIFQARLRNPARTGLVRARLVSSRETSVPFALKKPRDLYLSFPFGCGGPVGC